MDFDPRRGGGSCPGRRNAYNPESDDYSGTGYSVGNPRMYGARRDMNGSHRPTSTHGIPDMQGAYNMSRSIGASPRMSGRHPGMRDSLDPRKHQPPGSYPYGSHSNPDFEEDDRKDDLYAFTSMTDVRYEEISMRPLNGGQGGSNGRAFLPLHDHGLRDDSRARHNAHRDIGFDAEVYHGIQTYVETTVSDSSEDSENSGSHGSYEPSRDGRPGNW